MRLSESVAGQLLNGHVIIDDTVVLQLDGYKIGIRSNSAQLLEHLRHYFAHVLGSGQATDEVVCIDSEPVKSGFEFTDWQREAGKTGRKDAFCDLPDGRLVLKVRTGMQFLQSQFYRIAIGPCVQYDNQVINFINAQYMNWLQQHDALICHASGLVANEHCLGIAGFSGGGKSTLMLHMLEHADVNYLTNDRLFLNKKAGEVIATGIPKLPRINPGTIVHNPRLRPILSASRCNELVAMPKEELWHLEEKYDVDISRVYGPHRIDRQKPLSTFLLLNWHFNSAEPCEIKPVDLGLRRDLLKTVMKSPGPFYQFKDGSFYTDQMQPDEDDYLQMLQHINIYEATGVVDFEQAVDYCLDHMQSTGKG